MDSTSSRIFLYLIFFWTILAMLSYTFNVELTQTNIRTFEDPSSMQNQDESKTLLNKIFDFTETVPIIKYFVPLTKIMLFQYTDDVSVPMTLILNAFFLLTIFVAYNMLKPNS